MDSNVVIQLHKTVKDGKQEVTQLSLRRPKAIDLDVMDEAKGSHAGMRKLISRLACVSQAAVDDLDGFDYNAASKVVNDFLLVAPPIGTI